MSTKLIQSFADLHAMVQSYRSGHYIFRGESSTEFKLRPKFGRDARADDDDAREVEISLLREFMRRGSPHAPGTTTGEWAWLAVAQHFGLATRLLDWTENPLVAAYFAVSRLDAADRVIYVMDHEVLPIADQSQSPFDITEVVAYVPSHISTRIAAQSGLFTVHPKPVETFSHEKLDRWVIAESAIVDLGVALDRYGFNSSTLFPGLEGLAEHINDWHLRGPRDDDA